MHTSEVRSGEERRAARDWAPGPSAPDLSHQAVGHPRHTSVRSSRSSMSLLRWNTMFLDRASSSSGATSGTSSHCRSNTFSWLCVT